MRKVILLCGLICCIAFVANAELFKPGNVIFTDPFYTPDGQIIELKINGNEAEVVNAVRWNLDGATRRRALGLDVDPAGTVFVGITTTYDGQLDNPAPEGIGEILRIDKQGNQTFYTTDVVKSVFLNTVGVDELILNSNAADGITAYQYKMDGKTLTNVAEFTKTGNGEALKLPDGRILMGDSVTPGIMLYDAKGGNSTGIFSEVKDVNEIPRVVRSLTYNKNANAVIASLVDGSTLVRLNLKGEVEAEYNAKSEGFTGIWGVAQIPDSENVVVSNHNVKDLTNKFGIFDANNLAAGPRIITITKGFEQAGLAADTQFTSFFNMAVVPGADLPPAVHDWDLF